MMKIKKEYLFIALVIFSLVSYLLIRKSDRTEYQLPAVPKVIAGNITKIEVVRPGETVTLEKIDKQWMIQPQAYPADAGKITAMLTDLEQFSLTALVSETQSYSRYDLTPDKAIQVKAWVGDGVKRDIQIGKSASTYQHTYVRINDAPQVYQAQQNLKNAFDQTIAQLRDKTVLSFDPAEVKDIIITKNGQQTAFHKNEVTSESVPTPADGAAKPENTPQQPAGGAKPPEIQWLTDQGSQADISKINRLISSLSRLSCESYPEENNKSELPDPISSIVIKGNKDYTLAIYPKSEKEGSGYPAVSSENSYLFTLPAYQGTTLSVDPQTLMKDAEKKQEAAAKPEVSPENKPNISSEMNPEPEAGDPSE